jgi:hypothetical protein
MLTLKNEVDITSLFYPPFSQAESPSGGNAAIPNLNFDDGDI